MSELDALLDTSTTEASVLPPAENKTESGLVPLTMEEINALQQEVVLAKQGNGTPPSAERLKHAWESLRFYRSGVASSKRESAPKTKATPMSSNELDSLFGKGDL